jgi:hypothetical protein
MFIMYALAGALLLGPAVAAQPGLLNAAHVDAASATQPGSSRASSNSIAHQILRMEQEALTLSDPTFDSVAFQARYAVIDHILAEAKRRIVYNPRLRTSRQQIAQARRILATIESILVENNFVLRVGTEFLYEGLTPLPFHGGYQAMTDERDRHFRRHRNELFYSVDCDLSSVLYLAVAEELGLPVHMVEVPRHNFVRWRFSPAHHLNWDTNAAREYSDDDYRQGRSLTSSASFGREVEQAGRYLTDMTRAEIMGYFRGVTAQILMSGNTIPTSTVYWEQALAARPYWSQAKLILARLYLLTPELAGEPNHQRAFRLAVELDTTEPHNAKYKDLLACAYAATGDFDRAVEVERQAYDVQEKLAAFTSRRTCLDIGWS